MSQLKSKATAKIEVSEVKAQFKRKLQSPEYFTEKILNKKLWPVQAEILKLVEKT